MDAANKNARPGDEAGRARGHDETLESKSATNFEAHAAADEATRKPSFDDMRALVDAGYDLVQLGERGKAPVRRDWNSAPADNAAVLDAVARGANAGVRLGDRDLVIDVDPKNGGEASLERLVRDLGLDLARCPTVVTGSGGAHYYLRKPEGARLVTNLRDYPGIDFKSSGQVVAPGSVHPNGRRYESNFYAYGPDVTPAAPQALLGLLERRPVAPGAADRAGELTPRMLAANLERLDPSEFEDYNDWMNLMMACHHATAGEGLDEFVEWSTRAPGHADAAEVIAYKWNGLRVDDRGVTVQYLYRQLHDRGLPVFDRPEPEDDFEAVADQPPVDRRRRKRDWKVLSIDDLLNMPPPSWIVEGALQEQSVAVLFGPPGEGKSFVALDIALCMAAGIDWHGHAVTPGNVLFVAAEGAAGLGVRIQAWIREHGLASTPSAFQFFLHELTFADRDMAEDFLDFVADEAKVAKPRLIVVDTLSQTATGFEENSNTDMAAYFKRAQGLVNRTGATILVIHHTGKDASKGERGGLAIRGNVDTSIEARRVDAEGKRYVALHARKQKNGEERHIVELEMVRRVFVARDGTETSSLVLSPSLRSVAESDAGFLSEEVRLHDWIAKRLGGNGSAQLGELLKPLQEASIISGKERTLRNKLSSMIGEGFDDAKRSTDGTRIWLERDKQNPGKGPITIRAVKTEE